MRNKRILTIAAVAAFGTATMATSALAFPHGGGGRGVGGGAMASMGSMKSGAMGAGQGKVSSNFGPMHSNMAGTSVAANAGSKFNGPNANPNWNHNWHGHGHYAYRGQGYGYGYGGLYAFAPDYYDYSYDNSCYQWRWVPTPLGLRWRDVWGCD